MNGLIVLAVIDASVIKTTSLNTLNIIYSIHYKLKYANTIKTRFNLSDRAGEYSLR